MACKGVCGTFKDARINGGRYNQGFRRCITCEMCFKYVGAWCQCCGNRIRTKARNGSKKEIVYIT